MKHSHYHCSLTLTAVAVLFLLTSPGASVQEVGLVTLEVNEVARGFRANELMLRSVVNGKGEVIGRIDDFIFSRDDDQVFAVLAVGDFVGLGAHLIAVPVRSLKLDDPSAPIVLPGASREALLKLPVFLYDR